MTDFIPDLAVAEAPYDISQQHLLRRTIPCPKCRRDVYNICFNCDGVSLAFYADRLDFWPSEGVFMTWTYYCEACTYVGLEHYCRYCLCTVPLTHFIRKPPPKGRVWLWMLAAMLLGFLWP